MAKITNEDLSTGLRNAASSFKVHEIILNQLEVIFKTIREKANAIKDHHNNPSDNPIFLLNEGGDISVLCDLGQYLTESFAYDADASRESAQDLADGGAA